MRRVLGLLEISELRRAEHERPQIALGRGAWSKIWRRLQIVDGVVEFDRDLLNAAVDVVVPLYSGVFQ